MFKSLNIKSCFSLMESLIRIPEYISVGRKYNQKWLSLIDNSNAFGHVDFYNKCVQNNIKPILGVQIPVNIYDHSIEVALIAKNAAGYKNIIKLISRFSAEQKADIPWSVLKLYLNNNFWILNPNLKVSSELIFSLKNIRQEMGDFYIGVNSSTINFWKSQILWQDCLLWFPSVNYINANEQKIHSILTAITGGDIVRKDNWSIQTTALLNDHVLDAVCEKNLNYIVEQCNVTIKPFSFENSFVTYPTPDNINAAAYLHQLCISGLNKLLKTSTLPPLYAKRLEYELDVIEQKNFVDYFLVVQDYVNKAREKEIYVGPGRGSAAGSLVSFALGITNINPLKYGLLFERFLNLERTDLPDIDIDVEDYLRDDLVEYLVDKYGPLHVAYINTFQTIGIKMAIRDVGRVLDINLADINNICKLAGNHTITEIEQLIQTNKYWTFYADKYPNLFALIKPLIGLPRQSGTHAAGIIITQAELTEYTPIIEGPNGVWKTQWDMYSLDYIGLTKMDILGLRNLTVLHKIVNRVSRRLNKKVDLLKIPLNNAKTFRLLREGHTQGIFQLESTGMTNVLQKMYVNSLEDIIVTSSIYRPGPQNNINLYLQYKNHIKPVPYINKDLQPILQPTYGILIFQEQVMMVSQKVANFSLAKADLLRRAMAKKDFSYMKKTQAMFIAGAKSNNYSNQQIEEIWKLIYKFAAYGFNRAHAVSYSLLGYWMAFFKANYYAEFIAVLLDSVIGNDLKTKSYLQEAKKFQINVIGPNVNNPISLYETQNFNLYMPLIVIKQTGMVFLRAIQGVFQKGRFFKDVFDFVIRMQGKGLNKQIFEALCYSGALDDFGINRTMLYRNYDLVNNYAELIKVNDSGQIYYDYHLVIRPTLIPYSSDPVIEMQQEFKYLGFYITKHPVAFLRKKLQLENKTTLIKNLKLEQQSAFVLGYIKKVRKIKDKNGNEMAFVDLEDESGVLSITAFHSILHMYKQVIQENKIIRANIRLNVYKEKLSCNFITIELVELVD